MQSNVYVGIKPTSTICENTDDNGKDSLSNNLSENYDYVLSPITNGRYKELVKRRFQTFLQERQSNHSARLKIPEPQLQDVSISPFNENNDGETSGYLGLLSSWLELENPDIQTREFAYQVLLNECKYSKYIGVNKLILAPPRDLVNLQHYSQIVSRLLYSDIFDTDEDSEKTTKRTMTLSISLPLCEDSDPLATWELWNTIRKLCNYHSSLTISLAIPRFKTPSYVLNRWLSEPVSCLLISSSIFATNQYDFPVLHRYNQTLIRKFQEINGNSQIKSNELCILLHGMEKYSSYVNGGENSYLEYINYLLKKGDKLILTEFASGFNTPQLLPPLKPHSENLTNQVYSTFEKDEVKYNMYEKAIQNCIFDLRHKMEKSNPLIILVAGAGRGAIVDRLYHVIKKNNLVNKSKIIALEKNSEACLYLQKRNFQFWDSNVELVNEDMMNWKNESIKVDVCISELMGSFGCNELSPECLQSIEKYHSKKTTVFIPESYTSYVAPITSPLLYQKLTSMRNSDTYLETPWIAHKIPYQILSSKINELWSFSHPLSYQDLTKSQTTEFKIKHRGEIHALVGYFTARLYDDSTILSIMPKGSMIKTLDSVLPYNLDKLNHTIDLFSWSPIFFPLKQPLPVTDDTEISVLLSRIHTSNKVWFEWSMESFIYLVVSGATNGVHGNAADFQIVTDSNHKINRKEYTSREHQNGQSYKEKDQEDKTKKNTNIGSDDKRISTSYNNNFESIVDETETEHNKNTFLPMYENGWQSVNDIHGWITQDNISESTNIGQDHGHEHANSNIQKKVTKEEAPMFNLLAQPESTSFHNSRAYDNTEQQEDRQQSMGISHSNHIETVNTVVEDSTIPEEIHVRVKTGASYIHNINGRKYSIPLS